MLVYIVVLALFSFVISKCLPQLYLREKNFVINEAKCLEAEVINVEARTLTAVFIFLIPVFIFSVSNNMLLSVYCFVFAFLAFTDVSVRWLPDPAIYALIFLSVYSVKDVALISILFSTAFFILPALLFNIAGKVYSGKYYIANGDFYVFPAIGMMIAIEHAAAIMLLALSITAALSRFFKTVPLITVLYFIFMGYQTCTLSGLF